jgi:hypothetical protein
VFLFEKNMPYEKPKEEGAIFETREGQRFVVSEDVERLYHDVVNLIHPEGKLTYVPTESQIDAAKAKLHEKFILQNDGVEMPVDELLKNLDTYMRPL